MGTSGRHPVPACVKSSFVIFDIRALWRSGLSVTGCLLDVSIWNSRRQRVKPSRFWCFTYISLDNPSYIRNAVVHCIRGYAVSVFMTWRCSGDRKQPHQRADRDDVSTGVAGRTQLSSVRGRGGPVIDAQFRQHHVQSDHGVEFDELQSRRCHTTAERQHRSVCDFSSVWFSLTLSTDNNPVMLFIR